MQHSRFLRGLYLTLLVLFSSISPVSGQEAYNLPEDREPITPDNASEIVELAALKGPGALEGADSGIASLALSQDGSLLAFGTYKDKAIHLVDVTTGKEIGLLQGHNTLVADLAFSPDASILASAGSSTTPPNNDRSVRLWDVKTKKQRAVLQNSGGVHGLTFSPDGKLLAYSVISGATTQIVLVDVKSATKRKTLNKVFYAAFSPDSKLLASGSRDKLVHLWDAATGKAIKMLAGHTHLVQAIAFSPDGKLLASGGSDTTVRLWDVTTGNEVAMMKGRTGSARLAFNPDGKILASLENGSGIPAQTATGFTISYNAKDQVVRLWNTGTRTDLITLKDNRTVPNTLGSEGLGDMAFSADWTLIATASNNGMLRLWGIAKK